MIVIFAYHSITKGDYRYAITPKLFEQHLKFIKSRFKIIPLSELDEILEQNNQKHDFAVMTFDDGFRDNYTNAFPILREMGVPATIFLVTGLLGSPTKTPHGDSPMLTWPEILEMSNSGLISFQGHTDSHIDLTATEDTVIRKELSISKQVLNEKLGKSVDFFAYPKGRMNKKAKSIVGEYFSLAFAGNGIITNGKHIDKLAIPRVTIINDLGIGKLKLLTSPFYWRLKSLKKRLFS